jgi:hypothetical protein
MKLLSSLTMAIALIFLVAGCAQSVDEDQDASRNYHFEKVKVEESDEKFPLYRIAKGAVPTKEEIAREANSIKTLDELAPIAGFSLNGQLNARTQNDALKSYKAFIKEHEQDTVLIRHFRDRYATKLLLEYGFLHKADNETLTFLIEELLSSKTGRYHVIINALDTLRQTGDHQNHQRLLSTTISHIESSLELYKIAQQRLPGLIQKVKDGKAGAQGTLRQDFTVALLEKDDFKEWIQKLEHYRTAAINMKG